MIEVCRMLAVPIWWCYETDTLSCTAVAYKPLMARCEREVSHKTALATLWIEAIQVLMAVVGRLIGLLPWLYRTASRRTIEWGGSVECCCVTLTTSEVKHRS